MSIKEQIDEKFEELAEEEFSPRKEFKLRAYDAAKRRLDKDNVAKVAVLISFVGTIFAGMAVSYLNEQKILTAEGALLIIGGGLIYVGFRLFVLVYNYLDLKLQNKAIEADIKEATVRRQEAETDAYTAREKVKVAEQRMRFLKEQNRLDSKLRQDLQLRIPFFQDAQKHMMSLFARDDITAALKGATTLAEAVERMDDILLKRTSFDLTIDKMNARITDVIVQYDEIGRQTKENNTLLNQLIQRDAELVVKWRETDIALKRCEQRIDSLHSSIDTLMEMFSGSLTTENDQKTGSKKSEEPEKSEDNLLPVPEEPRGTKEPSIIHEVEKLLKDTTQTIASKINTVTIKSGTVPDKMILDEVIEEKSLKKEEDDEEDGDLPPPPTD